MHFLGVAKREYDIRWIFIYFYLNIFSPNLDSFVPDANEDSGLLETVAITASPMCKYHFVPPLFRIANLFVPLATPFDLWFGSSNHGHGTQRPQSVGVNLFPIIGKEVAASRPCIDFFDMFVLHLPFVAHNCICLLRTKTAKLDVVLYPGIILYPNLSSPVSK